MSRSAVVFEHVSKKFKRGERNDSLRDLLPSLVRRVAGGGEEVSLEKGEFWALQDVSFTVEPGRALGIIGPNGAGKSTILKLLTRILKPTHGLCEVRGRVGALIEIAAGFHPDLTGRENIFFQGAIMGMKRHEIARRFDEIVEFAGVTDFIDTPVKRYSSGMNAKLGFSIAAHLDPEVLIIDEVLSVGDMAFQAKCVERMNQFKRQGVTITFVSHNLQAVSQLCDEALYLQGSVRALGPTGEVMEKYISSMRTETPATGVNEIEIVRVDLLDEHSQVPDVVAPGTRMSLRARLEVHETMSDLIFGFILYRSTDGLVVFGGNLRGEELNVRKLSAGETIEFEHHFRANLTRGVYHIEYCVFHAPSQRHVSRVCPAGVFRVEEQRTYAGVADIELECLVHREPPASPYRLGQGDAGAMLQTASVPAVE